MMEVGGRQEEEAEELLVWSVLVRHRDHGCEQQVHR